jgi:prepilin-type N-terminal cleavage/methylation domain-containing protein
MGLDNRAAVITRQWRADGGQTLVEMLVVISILAIVLTPLITTFVTSMTQQSLQTRRENSQSNARSALARMRLDIHCAHATTLPVQQNPYGGFTLTLPENPGQCPAVVAASSGVSGIEWCTIPYPGSTTRFRLYRLNATTLAGCNADLGATFVTDSIAVPSGGWPANTATLPTPGDWAGNIWPTADTCSAGSLPTIAVDLNITADPLHPNDDYELSDRIAALNSDPC